MRAALWVLLLAACDEPAVATVSSAPSAAPSSSGDVFYGEPLPASWWTREKPCPDGAELRGSPPPNGKRVHCTRPSGANHGPSTTWSVKVVRDGNTFSEQATEQINFQGTYRDGKRDGFFENWWSHGPIVERGGYRAGQRHGRHEIYGPTGQLIRVELYEDGELVHVTHRN